MQVHIHPSSFVVGQPITPVSWPRKLPRPSHISVNTSRRPASADSTCTVSSTSSLPPSPSPISPSSSTSSLPSPHSSRSESEVHRAVSRLLSLTKQLQEVITLWANGSADEAKVSDAFVLVGSQFDSTVHAFWHVGIDMSDLYDVPTSLRTVLEGLLAEDPSPAVLARYSPRIRKIIVELLQGLQRKQTPYWSAIGRNKDNGYLSPVPATSMRDR
ncbi:uncharacterized protein TRAVEDRAFT_28969 [Trametes versicolor FP-101664 SS1]|uniref:uncharacterized protein n=1 Tax=Trametes versicolor (strain FP-101664) TaxID=717944 RepID=UPI0004623C04|nr:uncharacterized protein TRAVEDRAFT_28969 [Trametes versicolor FP-101664 SS1]EIW58304.1 hypothetical protein TRAVEDRAFT_28969 [Trametes versicolor FP-101664 SS1]